MCNTKCVCTNEKCGTMTNIKPDTRKIIMRSKDNISKKRQILAALAVSLGPFAAGLSKGYMSPAIDSLQFGQSKDFKVDNQQASWIASFSLLGALFGGILGGLAMRLGRRTVLLAVALPYTLAWFATSLSTSVLMLKATSFCGGLLVSCITMITQVYITEIAMPKIRGRLSSVLKILSQVGILTSYSLGAYLNWNQLALVVAVAPVFLFVALLFIPETPSFLLLREKDEEAEESLQWLRGPEADVRQELATIRMNIQMTKQDQEGRSGFKILMNKRLTRPVLITCGLMFFQKFTGAHVFSFYAVPMFRKTFRTMNPHRGAVATSVVQLLASCLSGLLIDNVGRLPLLMISGVMMSMALAGFGSYAYYQEVIKNSTDLTQAELGSYDWIPLVCVLTFTVAFSMGISPISSLLIGELFPLEYRSTGSALATSFSHLCGFVNVKTAADFQEHIGLYGLFWLYAGTSVLCLLFVILFVPETKGRKIDEMDPKGMESSIIRPPSSPAPELPELPLLPPSDSPTDSHESREKKRRFRWV